MLEAGTVIMRFFASLHEITSLSSLAPGRLLPARSAVGVLLFGVIIPPLHAASPSTLLAPIGLSQSQGSMITDLKKGGSTYFTAKMDNLSEQLHLTPDQQTMLRPIAEQETAYIEQIRTNPVLSLETKFDRLKTIVRGSDKQMKAFLSAQQWQKLQALRKEQQTTLEEYVKSR